MSTTTGRRPVDPLEARVPQGNLEGRTLGYVLRQPGGIEWFGWALDRQRMHRQAAAILRRASS